MYILDQSKTCFILNDKKRKFKIIRLWKHQKKNKKKKIEIR